MPALQTLNLKHFQIAHLLAQGKSQVDIAAKLNISPATIQNCLDTPEFNLTLEELKNEYSEKLIERTILPIAEMQNRINEESLGALARVVAISCADKANTTVLNANLALMDRASNVPKTSKIDSGESPHDLFSINVVQLVLETALQIGDKSILKSAQKALNNIPQFAPNNATIDIENEQYSPNSLNSSPFTIKSLDETLDFVESDE